MRRPGFLGIGGLGANILDGRDGDDFLNGWGGNDTLFGRKGMDVLLGGNGDDKLFGRSDNDRLKAEAGNDTLDGGDGIDTADYSGATSGVRMYVDAAWGGSEGTDVLVNMENITGSQYDDILGFNDLWGGGGNINYNTAHRIEGGGGNDDIEGGYFIDTLLGGDGDDVPRGDQGADVLTEGGGSDKFQFWAATVGAVTGVGAGNRDYVTDFQPGVDKLAFLGDPNGGPVLGPLSFIGEAALTQVGQIRVSYYGSDTTLQGNTDTDGAPEFEIQLSGHLTLSANDFLF